MRVSALKRGITAVIAACVLALLIAACVIASFRPKRDGVQSDSAPDSFSITGDNYIAYQSDGQCSAYAAAYVMRSLGTQISGEELYPDIGRTFGFVSPQSLAKTFAAYGYNAAAYHGDISALKARVAEGVPVIAFISIPNDTHYVAVTGYDKDFLYLADSLPENANAAEPWYNRKVSAAEFAELWRTDTVLPDNVYIVVKPLE